MSELTARPHAYSYMRLSTDVQLRGDSLRRQKSAVDAWCAANSMSLDEDLRDIGVSGFSGANAQRGALASFLTLIEAGRVPKGSVLILEALDRLTRQQVRAGVRLLLGILEAGVDVVTLADGYRYRADADPTAQMTELIISVATLARGHDESRMKSLRLGAAWAEKKRAAREECRGMTAKCPGWLRFDNGRYLVIPERAALVRRMAELSAEGRGRRLIARILNEEKVPTWGAAAAWQDSYVQKILTSRAPIGWYQPHAAARGAKRVQDGGEIENYFPKIVDEELWARAQAAAVSRRAHGGRRGTFKNVLQGLCRCAICGEGMHMVDKGKRSSGPKFECSGHRRRLGCEHADTYKYKTIETGVFLAIEERIDELLARAADARSRADDQLISARARRADLQVRIDRLLDALEEANDPDASTRLRVRRCEAEALDQEIEKLHAQVLEAAPSASGSDGPRAVIQLNANLRAMLPDEQAATRARINQGLRRFIGKIMFDRGKTVVQLRDGGSATLVQMLPAGGRAGGAPKFIVRHSLEAEAQDLLKRLASKAA